MKLLEGCLLLLLLQILSLAVDLSDLINFLYLVGILVHDLFVHLPHIVLQ